MSDPPKEYDYDPRHLSPDALAAIGLVATCGAQTESLLTFVIGGCLGLEDARAFVATVGMTATMKLDEARRAAGIRFDDSNTRTELNRLLDSVGEALNKRDGLVLTNWFQDPETTHLFRRAIVGGVALEMIPVPLIRLAAEADFIYRAGHALMSFVDRHGL